MMGFFSNLFAKQNCAVCGKECGTLHRSKLRDGQFLCDDCGNKCSKYIRLSELTLDEAKEHMEYMARMKRVFDEVFDKTDFRVNAYPSTPTQMGLVFCDELGMLYIDDRTGGRGKMPELIRYDQIASYEEYLDETPAKEPGQEPTLNGGGLKLKLVQPRSITEAQTQRGMHPHPYHQAGAGHLLQQAGPAGDRLCPHRTAASGSHLRSPRQRDEPVRPPDVQGRGTGAEGPDGHDRCHGCRGIRRHEGRAALRGGKGPLCGEHQSGKRRPDRRHGIVQPPC